MVAIVAALVALAAVAALVVVQVRGGSADSSPERGFGTPEEAVTYVAEHLSAGDAAGASEAFAQRRLVEGYSFEAEAKRLQSVTYLTWLPGSASAFDEINEGLRRGAIADQLDQMAAVYGAEAVQEAAVLYDTAAGPAMGGAFLIRYDGRWYVWALNSPLLGTPYGQVEPTSEEDYLAAVDQARG